MDDQEGLEIAIIEIFDEVPKTAVRHVFAWTKWLKWLIQHKGHYLNG
jgi:hypothetical protein